MTNPFELAPRSDHGLHERDFIAASHRRLPMVRVLLPMRDDADRVVRWSEYVSLEDELASLDWRAVVERNVTHRPRIRDLESCRGVIDAQTSAALGDAVGDLELTALRWTGYAMSAQSAPTIRVYGNEFASADFRRGDVRAAERLPEFVWDAAGVFAWGTHLYPDSLIVAAEITRLRRIHADPRLDTIAVRVDSDALPPSAGD